MFIFGQKLYIKSLKTNLQTLLKLGEILCKTHVLTKWD
jgi:hypothetical protein